MRSFWLHKALWLGCCLSGHDCLGQHGPIAPLPPSQPAVVVPAPWQGVVITKAAPAAAAPMARPARPVTPGPLLLLDTRLLIGGNYLAKVNPQDIQSLRLYKEPATTPAPWGELARYGIIDITLKKPLRGPSQRLAQLGKWLRARGAAYLVNGMTVTNTSLRIATSAIKEITISYTLAGPVISVQVFSLADMPATPHPPGTIMIRGTASR